MTQMVLTVTNWLNFQGIVDGWLDFKRKRQVAALRRNTVRELSQLSDADLHDIGLCRGDIRSVANGTFYKDASPELRARISDDHLTTDNTNDNLKGWV
jgi:uncharacterized protein YjiS (DUF1127 family)